LRDYALPVFPMAAPWFAIFDAKIGQGGQIRKVGYWLWRGGTAETSPNSTLGKIQKILERLGGYPTAFGRVVSHG
jgi:hypothetical protein